jgi:hypothetical protein
MLKWSWGNRVTYFEQGPDDRENDDGEHGHDDATDPVSLHLQYKSERRNPYHVHAFIADTSGFTMVGNVAE